MTKAEEYAQANARKELRELLDGVTTIYTMLRHASDSGMMRVIDLFFIKNNEPRRISYTTALATGRKYNSKHEGVEIHGCGMDMGFALVYTLSFALYGDGYKLSHRWL